MLGRVSTLPEAPEALAAALIQARRTQSTLPSFPGQLPDNLTAGYAIQDAAIRLWSADGDTQVGWKIGYVGPAVRTVEGDDRVLGPMWASQLHSVDHQGQADVPVFGGISGGGFAAGEAELVLRLDADVESRSDWTAEAVAHVAGSLFCGIEVASSPLAEINNHGPSQIAADLGNNNGLVLGPEIPDWRTAIADLPIRSTLDGEPVGEGAAASVVNTILGSLASAWNILARRERPLLAGQLFATGATTGIHQLVPGQTFTATYGLAGGDVQIGFTAR